MDQINTAGMVPIFAGLAAFFAEKREFLIALDGKVGDSDLGLTMSKAFAAAHEAVIAENEPAIATYLKDAGMAMAKAAPSTMGTLMATGFLRASKALDGVTAIGTPEMAAFWRAYSDGVAQRGKAKVGDKTVVDVLEPIAASLETSAEKQIPLPDAMAEAVEAASAALENTKTMVAQHGKAAAFQEKSKGLQDAGATVALFIIQSMTDTVRAA
ncbi:dihydroxyacetone kinase family protein [Martelella radicis]|uniref:Dihydroxyacetone kinase-like protein n=1 Tax=Martelella radicis TaxID=1397476 RepID=A0A7W6PC72_9HYPH|nr:DAK2 domain-containing protein [Martelella radicis]MBB4124660.1 dihydroxyacetone kinase-like protein [Martelella radicis]